MWTTSRQAVRTGGSVVLVRVVLVLVLVELELVVLGPAVAGAVSRVGAVGVRGELVAGGGRLLLGVLVAGNAGVLAAAATVVVAAAVVTLDAASSVRAQQVSAMSATNAAPARLTT
jgi:hypothetical protein